MNVGDIIRVTSKKYPNAAAEGEITELYVHAFWTEVVFKMLWDNHLTVSTEHFDVEVIRRVEPKTIGTVHKDKNTHIWTRYSNMPTIIKPWVNEYGVVAEWSELT